METAGTLVERLKDKIKNKKRNEAMNKFYLPQTNKILDISQYRPEYNGKIKCEDKKCRVPIFYVPSSKITHYFRVSPTFKHHPNCDVKSKSKKNKNQRQINKITGVPVLNLKESRNEITIDGSGVNKKGRRLIKTKKPGIDPISSIRRIYMRDIISLGRYISRNFSRRDELNVMNGGNEIKLDSIVLSVEKVLSKKNTNNNQELIVLGQIIKIDETNMGGHLNIRISDDDTNEIRIFVKKELISEINSKMSVGKCVLINGKFTKEYNNQIILDSSKKLYVFSDKCTLF